MRRKHKAVWAWIISVYCHRRYTGRNHRGVWQFDCSLHHFFVILLFAVADYTNDSGVKCSLLLLKRTTMSTHSGTIGRTMKNCMSFELH